MPFVVGETIGPYRIMEQLGRGGMATVFKAYHAALDRYVAIKALHPAFLEDPNFHARFQREARVVARLEHPNIVPIYDFAEYESRPYLVMKYIEGDTLKARLNVSPVEQAELARIVEAVGAGLSYAHRKGILHRDVKPSNVLLATDGSIYLADFGLARIAQAGESTLSSDMMLGTPQYISPEQAMGGGELDQRTDIYSFGVMLYEMVVGKVPFSADTPFSIIHDHIYKPLPLPRLLNPRVSEPVERVLLKALAKERGDRYPDAESLVNAFIAAISAASGSLPGEIIHETEKVTLQEIETPPESDALPASSSTLIEPAPGDSPTIEPGEEAKPAKENSQPITKSRRRFRWWFIPLGLILVVIACFCLVSALGALRNLAKNAPITSPSSGQPVASLEPQPLQEVNPLSDMEIPALEEAQAWVDEDPENPDAWLDLALAHWADGQIETARGAQERALELAGEDPDFYFETAGTLAEWQLWVEAAHVYLKSLQRFFPGDVPPEVLDEFHEAVYKAAEFPEAETVIPIPGIARPDPLMERVTKARYLFHFGDQDEAFSIVEQVLTETKPGMPEALYLQSEIFYDWGETQAAYRLLFDLQAREDTPDWIREEVEVFLQDAIQMREMAQDQVDNDPENPYVYLPLYEWYLGVGLFEQAQETIQQAVHLAEDDPDFLQIAGDVTARNKTWLPAARLYAQAGSLEPQLVTPEFSEKVIQALYYGAVDPNALEVFAELEPFFPEGERGTLRQAFRDALVARYKLYNEDAAGAQALIEDVLNRAPMLPLARLVQADVYRFEADFPQSETILLDLQHSRTTPSWIQNEVQAMLAEIKP